MDFEKFSKETAGQINIELKKLLDEWRNEVRDTSVKLLPLVDKFISSCQGGKRIRGVLVVLGYEIGKQSSAISCQSSDKTSLKAERLLQATGTDSFIFKVAAAYEIFHAAILAHDDVIDQSKLRRGQPSLYQALGGDHHGVSQAISLGDAGFFLATRVILKTFFDGRQKLKALQRFCQTMLDTAMGEMLDVEKGEALSIMKLKTARYTITGPLVLGAILGGTSFHLERVKACLAGSPREAGRRAHLPGGMDKLEKFGENLGIAFQIQDDILGVFGDEETLGKSATSDMEEGKNTLLYNYALQKADPSHLQILAEYYGKGVEGTQEDLKKIRQVFKETGALDFVKKEAEKYKNQALKILPKITKDKKMSKLLQQMARYLVQRTK